MRSLENKTTLIHVTDSPAWREGRTTTAFGLSLAAGTKSDLPSKHSMLDNLSLEATDRLVVDSARSKAPDPSKTTIRQQLERILQSKTFIQSDKLSRFLSFVVEHTIDGKDTCLKEYTIGAEVYGRRPPYHPSQDSIVRTEARRLRAKLKEYYEVEGKDDLIYLYLRPGSYIPVFQSKERLAGLVQTAGRDASSLGKSTRVVAVVFPFQDISGNAISSSYARGIADELAYALMLNPGCTVVSCASMLDTIVQQIGIPNSMSKVGAQIAYEGTVRAEGTSLRVTTRIVDATGRQLWLRRIDADVESESPFKIQEQVAIALSAGFHLLLGLA